MISSIELYKYIPPPIFLTKEVRSILWELKISACCICYEYTEEPFKTPCNHAICMECSERLKEYNLNQCPMCRVEIFLKQSKNTVETHFGPGFDYASLYPSMILSNPATTNFRANYSRHTNFAQEPVISNAYANINVNIIVQPIEDILYEAEQSRNRQSRNRQSRKLERHSQRRYRRR